MKAESTSRVPELDGLRGMAILLVLLWHYYASVAGAPISTATALLRFPLRLSWSGVDLFFVLSGYLIGGILLDHRDAPNYFKVFYVRRFFRIVPLYFLWLLIFILLSAVAGRWFPAEVASNLFGDPLPLLSYFTFTQNFAMAARGAYGPEWLAVTWSLAIEEQFYLLLPLIIRVTPRRWLPRLLVFLILMAPLARIVTILVNPDATIAAYVLLFYRADALFLGVLCAVMLRNPAMKEWLVQHIKVLYGLLLVFVLGAAWLCEQFVVNPQALATYGYSWLALMYTCFLLITLLEKQGPLKALARLPLLGRFGLLAYGLYIAHQGVLGLLHGGLLGQEARFHSPLDAVVTLLAFGVTFLLAQLSWTYFEKPLVAQGHRLSYATPEPTE